MTDRVTDSDAESIPNTADFLESLAGQQEQATVALREEPGSRAKTERRYVLSVGRNAETKEWSEKEFSLDDLMELLTDHRETNLKNGMCFVPGRLVEGKRTKNSTKQIDMLVYDIDGNMSLEDLIARLDEVGVTAVLYTTFSHKVAKTKIKTDHFQRWAKQVNVSIVPALGTLIQYLADHKKGHLKNIQFAGAQHVEHTADGLFYVLEHDPVDKMRVCCPLEKPIVLAKLSQSTQKMNEEYRAIYFGVGQALGLPFDESCADPSRLHYFGAHPKGTSVHKVYRFDGPLLDWTKYPKATIKDQRGRTVDANGNERPKTIADLYVTDANNIRIDLKAWDAKNRHDFDIETLFRTKLPDEMIKADRTTGGGGFHIECAFDQEHSTPGGTGTFCVNSNGQYPWTIHCSHNSCQSAKRGRLDFLREYIKMKLVTAEDLGIEQKPLEEVYKDAGIDPSTIALPAYEEPAQAEEFELAEEEKVDINSAREGGYAKLKTVRWELEAHTTLASMIKVGVPIVVEEIMDCLSEAPIVCSQLKKLHNKDRFLFNGMSQQEFIERITEVRRQDNAVLEQIRLSIDRGYGSKNLDRELDRLADYFDLSKKDARARWNAEYVTKAKLETDPNVWHRRGEMNARYAKIKIGRDVLILDVLKTRETGEQVLYTRKSLDDALSNEVVEVLEKDARTGNEKVVKKKLVKCWWEEAKDIQFCDGMTFEPSLGPVTADNKFNLWSGRFARHPVGGDTSIFLDHVKHVWCEGDESLFNWVITFLANVIQKPGDKAHAAIVLLGGQGTGKSILFEHCLRHILGPYYGSSLHRDDITGKFNAHTGGKLMWLAEESLFAGAKESMNVLKGIISAQESWLEPKGVDKYRVPSFVRYIFTSNNIHPLSLDADDRRFLVLRTTDQHKQDTAYFAKMRDWFYKEQGIEKVLHFLLNWKPEAVGFDWSCLYNPPMTRHKAGQIAMSRDPGEEFFVDLLRNGRITSGPPHIFTSGPLEWKLDEDYQVSAEKFQNAFECYLGHHMGSSKRFDRTKFFALFGRYICDQEKPTVEDWVQSRMDKTIGKKVRSYVLPKRLDRLKAARTKGVIADGDVAHANDDPNSHEAPPP